MNKQWEKPELEVLDVKLTMAGSPNNVVDYIDPADGELGHGPS